tara:strand:+ start:279 stop:953 length:675 start_codon:yes stop_codon:yes gene_type:complete
MKKVFILLISVIGLVSCSDDENSNDQVTEDASQIEGSLALRATLENIKNIEQFGRSMQDQNDLCFQFEYPISLEYNDDAIVSVNSYSDLLELLLNETMDNHITAIQFPFNIIQNETTSTISGEGDFQSLVADCDYDMVSFDDVVAITESCFTINYPLTVFVNDESQTFNSQSEAQSFFLSYDQEINAVGFDYPFDVTLIENNTLVTINDDYELITLVRDTCGIE